LNVAFRIERQHPRREGEEILGVEADSGRSPGSGDQEEEDQPADDAERVVPDALTVVA
jgi:hypothetical protein